jgi:hypothetical protein
MCALWKRKLVERSSTAPDNCVAEIVFHSRIFGSGLGPVCIEKPETSSRT